MRYLCLAYYDKQKFDALSSDERKALISRCPPHDAALRQGGHLVLQASLSGIDSSVTIRPRNGEPSVTDGPFAEMREQVGGFFIIEARDLNEAIRVASKHPAAHLGEDAGWGLEIRPIGTCE